VSSLRQRTCCSTDFLEFVKELFIAGALIAGDFLLCDNARIHCAAAILDELSHTLRQYGVRLLYLPTYSPELNPCELVFSKSKTYLRYHRGNDSFDNEIVESLAGVSFADMAKFYEKCIVDFEN
jgi:transposase